MGNPAILVPLMFFSVGYYAIHRTFNVADAMFGPRTTERKTMVSVSIESLSDDELWVYGQSVDRERAKRGWNPERYYRPISPSRRGQLPAADPPRYRP